METTLKQAQAQVQALLHGQSILVGHSLDNDLQALQLGHPRVIDTSCLYARKGHKLKLRDLAYRHLGLKIQTGKHDSAEDARAALALARLKVEILDPLSPSRPQFEVLDRLRAAGPVLLLDQEQALTDFRDLAVHLDAVDSPGKCFSRVKYWTSGQVLEPRVLLASIRCQGDWGEYYSQTESGIR